MELTTKSTSFPLLPSSENKDLTESQDPNEISPKPFFKLFSVSRNVKRIDDLLMDETNEFLENLIDFKNENKKETMEIDFEFQFKIDPSPFQNADKISQSQEFYRIKYPIVDHHNEALNRIESFNSQGDGDVMENSKPTSKNAKPGKEQQEVTIYFKFFLLKKLT